METGIFWKLEDQLVWSLQQNEKKQVTFLNTKVDGKCRKSPDFL